MIVVTVQGIDEQHEMLYATCKDYSTAYRTMFDQRVLAGSAVYISEDGTSLVFGEKITFVEDNGCTVRFYCSEPF